MNNLDSLRRDEQRSVTPNSPIVQHLESRIKELHTCLPGIIVSYDPAKQTAEVQPAIRRIFTGTGAVNLPLCVDVPVAFPGGGDFYLTFPVEPGDECILLFSERAIDNWYSAGDVQDPAEYRLHDLSDGLAMVGLNSQPRKLSNVQTDGAELRNRARTKFIKLLDTGIVIQGDITHTGNLTQTGNITLVGNITQTGNQTTSGTIIGTTDVVGGGVSLAGEASS